jgi:hypothetical protein
VDPTGMKQFSNWSNIAVPEALENCSVALKMKHLAQYVYG